MSVCNYYDGDILNIETCQLGITRMQVSSGG